MSIEVERATVTCGVCGALVSELRRGRCWGCYSRWVELRPVGKGAACVVCNERRRDQLRLAELHNRSVPMCHGCASRALKLAPLPETIEEIRQCLRRDRRDDDRRNEAPDRRIFPRERRVGERRHPPREGAVAVTTDDAVSLQAELDDLVIEIEEGEYEIIEQTMVQERPAGLKAE